MSDSDNSSYTDKSHQTARISNHEIKKQEKIRHAKSISQDKKVKSKSRNVKQDPQGGA